jgi:hypothetical protein
VRRGEGGNSWSLCSVSELHAFSIQAQSSGTRGTTLFLSGPEYENPLTLSSHHVLAIGKAPLT